MQINTILHFLLSFLFIFVFSAIVWFGSLLLSSLSSSSSSSSSSSPFPWSVLYSGTLVVIRRVACCHRSRSSCCRSIRRIRYEGRRENPPQQEYREWLTTSITTITVKNAGGCYVSVAQEERCIRMTMPPRETVPLPTVIPAQRKLQISCLD